MGFLAVGVPSAAAASVGDVVISEIMYDAISDYDTDEFLEVANTTNAPIDVSGWCFSGVTLCLPTGSSIAANGFLTVAPDAERFRTLYGFDPAGVYTGKLSNGGEKLTVKDAAGVTIDSVTYSDGDGWPVTPDGGGQSLELRDPSLDHNDPLNWAASIAARGHTAGAVNSTARRGFSPRISGLTATPAVPNPGQTVQVSATILDSTSASLRYRQDFGPEQSVALSQAGDTFTGSIPGVAAGHIIRYRVVASNAVGQSTLPRTDDTIVYEGVIPPSGVQSAIPILEWFIPDPDYNAITSQPTVDIRRPAVIAYDGKVYDNTMVNIRGAISQTSAKPSWQFELAHNHPMDMPGKLVEPIDEFAMQGDFSDHSRGRPLLAWDAYQRAGVVNTQVFPMRTQRNGAFQGLYTYTDLFDGTWRDREGYSDKELYKASHDAFDESRPLNDYRMEKKNPSDPNYAPIRAFLDGIELSGSAQRDYVLANVDIPQMLNYAAVTAIVKSSDASNKNWYNSQDPSTGRWSTIPWDLDKTWGNTCCGIISPFVTPSEPGDTPNRLMAAVLSQPEWRAMYFRRLKTLLGDILAPGRAEALFDAKVGPAKPEFALDLQKFTGPASWGYDSQRTQLFSQIAARRTAFANDSRVPAAQSANPNILISEIQPSPTAGGDAEFLELYNPSATEAVDLSGWSIADGVTLNIPPGTVILPKDTMTFVANDPTFRTTFGLTVFVGGHYSGGLSAGETLTLKRADGSTADAVSYGGSGWPAVTDGRSLELNDPTADNNDGANWRLSAGGGTPGVANFAGGGGGNVVPVAAFSSVVSGSSVSFDASGSADPDGSVVSYAWDFGDGSVGSGVAPSHPYAAAGSYTVRLTVTDNGGATAAVTHPVSISSAPSSALGFVGAAHSDSGATRFKEAVVPASAKVGDTMVLFLTRGSAASWGAPGGVTGWTQLDSFTVGSVTSTVWKKTVAAGDPGSVVRVDASTYTKGVLSVAVYSGVSGSALGASSVARVGDAGTASHTSPGVTVPAGAWVVNYWGEKSSATTGWTAPGGVATRDTSTGTGSGRYASLLVDSGEALPAGSYPTRTATTNSTSSNSANWTITLTPSGGGGGGNVVPVAAFSSVVSGSSVSFDASGSADPDGSVVSYAWDFGDGSVGSGVAPSHPYAAAGSYTVRLTVTDNGGATAAVTHPVSISSAPSSALGFVGAAHSDSGATRFKEAVVPASAKVGDTMVLFLTRGSAASWGAPGGVTGWTQLDSFTVGSVTSTVWKKTVAAGDPGSVVRVDASTYTKGVLSVAVYSGVSGSALGASSVARVGDAGTASHTSPGVTVPAGAWVVNYWGEKSSATTGWTAPGGVATRDTSTGTGSGRYASLLVDSGEALPAGSYPTRTATTNSTSSNSANWTITLTPHN